MLNTTYAIERGKDNHSPAIVAEIESLGKGKWLPLEELSVHLAEHNETVDSMINDLLTALTQPKFPSEHVDTMLEYLVTHITDWNAFWRTRRMDDLTFLHLWPCTENQQLVYKIACVFMKHCLKNRIEFDINIMRGHDPDTKEKLDNLLVKYEEDVKRDPLATSSSLPDLAHYFVTPLYTAVEHARAPFIRLFLIHGATIPHHLGNYHRTNNEKVWTYYQAVKTQLAVEKRARFAFVTCSKRPESPVSWLPKDLLKLIWRLTLPDEYFL